MDINDHNVDGVTALHVAVKRENAPLVKLLLQTGADPNIRDHQRTGNTPFMSAVISGNTDVIAEFFADFRTDWEKPNARGQTPIEILKSRYCGGQAFTLTRC
jgi:ankyrin repeat protein